MFSRAFGLTLSLAVLALFMGAEHVLAQGQGQGPPSIPPGLHDRPLPPGKPFDQGGFDPPGHRSAALTDDLPEAVRVTLERLLPRVGLGEAPHLRAAVEAFNAHVDGASETVLRDPPPGFVAARILLAAHLELAGVDPAPPVREARAPAVCRFLRARGRGGGRCRA